MIYASTYDANTKQGAVVALAANTLQNVWSMPLPYNVSSMAVANGRLYVTGPGGTRSNMVYSFGNR